MQWKREEEIQPQPKPRSRESRRQRAEVSPPRVPSISMHLMSLKESTKEESREQFYIPNYTFKVIFLFCISKYKI